MPIRSLLWIGRARHFAADLIADAPSLDVTFEDDLERALAHPFAALDAVVLDVADVDSGRRALERLRDERPRWPVVVRVDLHGDDPAAWTAAGASAVLPLQPFDARQPSRHGLVETVERVVAVHNARERKRRAQRERPSPSAGIVGESSAMRRLFELISRAGRSTATVLISGETGTGKEVVARAIHDVGSRRGRPFIAFNCAAFPETLLESELFGHTRGAFTGADRDKPGLFEAADGGSLFLDEVSETSGPFQAKLLRVLQEREIRALGSRRTRRVDVRVVAASNRDLRALVRTGGFREDLFYRLAIFPVTVPPLRERPDDVLLLANHFLALHGEREAKPGVRLAPEAAELLASHRWPGNVRELENEIQRALALADPGDALIPEDFELRVATPMPLDEIATIPGESLRESLQRLEAILVRRCLELHRGRRTQTAKSLGITREGLYKKMKRLGIE